MVILISRKLQLSAKRTPTSASKMTKRPPSIFSVPILPHRKPRIIGVHDERKRETRKENPNLQAFFDIGEAYEVAKTYPSTEPIEIVIYPGSHRIKRPIVVDRNITIKGYKPYGKHQKNVKPVVFSTNTLMFEFIEGSKGSRFSNIICQLSNDPIDISPLEWIPIVRTWDENIHIEDCGFFMDDDDKFLGISVEKGSVEMSRLSFNGGSTGVFLNEKTKVKMGHSTINECISALVVQNKASIEARFCEFEAKQYGITSTGGKGTILNSTVEGRVAGLYSASCSNLTISTCKIKGGQMAAFFKDGKDKMRRCEFSAGSKYTLSGIGVNTNPDFWRCNIALEHKKSINRVNSPRFRFPNEEMNTFDTTNWKDFTMRDLEEMDEVVYTPPEIKDRLIRQGNEISRLEREEAARLMKTMPAFRIENYR